MSEATNDHSQRLLQTLRKVEILSALDENTLRLLQDRMERATYSPGEVLCREGEAGDRMFIIESG